MSATHPESRKMNPETRLPEEALFRLLADVVDDIVFVVDEVGATTRVNRRWVEFTGLTAEETKLAGWEAAAHPEDAAVWRSRHRGELRPGDSFRLRIRLKGVGGSHADFDAVTHVESSGGGPRIWMVSARAVSSRRTRFPGFRGIVSPIVAACLGLAGILAFLYLLGLSLLGTGGGIALCLIAAGSAAVGYFAADRRKRERDGASEFEALRESNRRLVLALKGAKDSLWDRDLITGELYRSDRWKELRGYEPYEFGDKSDDWERTLHPDDADRVKKAFQDHIDGKTALFNVEYRVICKDGSHRWILDRGEAIRDRNGKATRVSGFETDISERKEAERELNETRRRYEGIIASAMDAIISLDDELRIIIFNAAAEKLFGARAETVLGGKIDQFLPDHVRPSHADLIHRFGNEESASRRMTAARLLTAAHADGTEFPIEASISSIALGNRKLYTVILRDVTERVRTERLMARQADALEKVAAGSPLSDVLTKVCETVEILSKDSLCSVLLLEDDGLLRTAAGPSLPAAYTAAINQGVPPGPRSGSCGTAVYRRQVVVVSDIHTDPLWDNYRELGMRFGLRSCWSSPVISPAGEPIGTFAIYSRSQRVPSKQDLELIDGTAHLVGIAVEAHRSREARRESEERFRLALEAGRLGTFRHDFKTNLIQYDERARRQRGFDKEILTLEEALRNVHPEDRPRVEEAIRKSHQAESAEDGYGVEERIILPDGSIRWLSVLANIHFQGTGSERKPTLVVGTIQDITERKRAEEVLRENDRRKSEFLAMLGHELRNPLAAINNAAEVLNLKVTSDSELAWSRDVIARQVVQLTSLVDELLDISRVSKGKISLKKTHLDARVAMARAAESVRAALDEKGHAFKLQVPPEPLPIEFDEARLQQVLSNLLTNAVKYTDPHGSIRMSAERSGDDVVIRVEDNGIGIAHENLSQIFALFSQVDSSIDRAEGGLGIGLTLVQSLVELHGGRVSVDSRGLGHGSVFEIRVPRVEAPLGAIPSAPKPPERTDISKRRILVVDDNVDTANGLARLLKHSGFEVRVEHDGNSAFAAIGQFTPEVVISDIGLPGMSGYALAECIRRTADGASLLLVAISGYGQDGDREQAGQAGFDRHLTKPVEFQTLLDVIAEGKSNSQTAMLSPDA